MLLTGSYARYTATRYSDVDLLRFVDELPETTAKRYTLRYRQDRLVSISTTTVRAKRAELCRLEGAVFAVEELRRVLSRGRRCSPRPTPTPVRC